MTPEAIDAFMTAYADAFSRGAVDEICAKWAYPATIAARGKRTALDAAQFCENTNSLCAFYAVQGMRRAAKKVINVTALTASIAAVRTADTLFDAAGAVLLSWEHAYIVSETPDGLRAIAAFPDAELNAWQSRGTRLGTW